MQPALLHQAGCAVKAGQLQTALAEAHRQLRISPAQDTDWTVMAQQITDAAKPLVAQCGRTDDTPPSWHEEAALLRGVADAGQAVTTMYGKLTPAQKDVVEKALQQAENVLPGLTRPGR